MNEREPFRVAKIIWNDPETGTPQEYYLNEGSSITIGRSSQNDICIPDRHVSRQHTAIKYTDGIFMIADLESANGTFVNDLHLTEPFPLASGDVIRLYVPTLVFQSIESDDHSQQVRQTGTLVPTTDTLNQGQLEITSGPQQGHIIPLLLQTITIGRATSNATWEVGLQDPSVSRPHARLSRIDDRWYLADLNSSNGTFINDKQIEGDGHALKNGDRITFGATIVIFQGRD